MQTKHLTVIKKSQQNSNFDALEQKHFWAYGMGHFLNDLTAACWFNYLLFFLQTVVKTSAAPIALLAGQITDGIVTPVVGYLSDRYDTNMGKRTPWYVFGLVMIVICFIPIFSSFKHDKVEYQYIYYAVFPGIFNIGWASLQISHMSLVPSLTCSRKRRDRLNNIRNSFTFIANLLVLLIGLTIFYLMDNKNSQYRLISYIVVGIGLISSIFFLCCVKEKQLVQKCKEKKEKFKIKLMKNGQNDKPSLDNQQSLESDRHFAKSITQSTVDDNVKEEDVVLDEGKKGLTMCHWLKKPKFYLFGICYMCVRLNSNVFGTFIPFYLIYVLQLQTKGTQQNTIPFSVALVPLIIYFSSSLLSAKISSFYAKIGRKNTLVLGTFLSTISLGLLFALDKENGSLIYILAVLIGFSQSLILTTGINLISDVVGSKSESGAIVFGIYSFLDKISAGIIIYFIAQLSCFSTSSGQITSSQELTIKLTAILIPMISAIVAAVAVLCGSVSQYIDKGGALSESKMQKQQFVHSITIKQ